MKKTIKFILMPLAAALALFFACNKSDEVSIDDAVDTALFNIQERGGMGRLGCFELIFPLTLSYSDGTTDEVDSYEELKQSLRAYFTANGGGSERPTFVFPISVVSQDGDLISVNDQDELQALRAECRGHFGNSGPQGHSRRWLACFDIIFPLTIQFPDGATAQADDRQELHQLIRAWRQDHPGVQERPQIVFPITVKMTEDGSEVTVNSRQELHDLKENCN